MQTMRVTLEFTMHVPDNWRIVGIEKLEAGCIEIDGTRYEPGLMWMKVTDMGGGTSESEQVDEDTYMMFMEHVTACKEDVHLDDPIDPNKASQDIDAGAPNAPP